MKTDRSKIPDSNLDIRVRDRLVAAGTLDQKALEQHLAELPDLEAECEAIAIDQPALSPHDSE